MNRLVSLSTFIPAMLMLMPSMRAQVLLWQKDTSGITLLEDAEPIYRYQRTTRSLNGTYPRAHYIHPLYGLNGEIITEDFPEDHPHHRGIFWAWHQLYVGDQKLGDSWSCENIGWEVDDVKTDISYRYAELKTRVLWKSNLGEEDSTEQVPVIKEETSIAYTRVNGATNLDFTIELVPLLRDIRLGGSDDEKGYGGFSARLKLPEDVLFRGKKGTVIPQINPVDAGGWVDLLASFDAESAKIGVTLMNHPDNPPPFQGWILRDHASMQNAAWPGRKPILLRKGKKVTLRYRIMIHAADWSLSDINIMYEAYSKL